MLRALSLCLLVLFAAPALAQAPSQSQPPGSAAQEYRSKELAEAAADYRKELLESIPANKRQPAMIPRLRRDAEAEYRAKRYAQAIDDLTRAIGYGADD